MKNYDVVIVGGGFAGLSAALLLGRSRRRVLVSDTGKTRNAVAQESHGFFTRDGATPAELVRIGREQLRPYETVELCSVGVKAAKAHSKGFEITLDDETRIACRKAIVIRTKQQQHSALAKQLGCEFTESGTVKVDDFGQTSIPGVYAGGDMTHPMQHISFAVSRGALAAVGINRALLQEDFR